MRLSARARQTANYFAIKRLRSAKIICGGLPKTGTTSLEGFLSGLGLRVLADPYNTLLIPKYGTVFKNSRGAEVDCVSEMPACANLYDISGLHPDAFVIVTSRSFESWMRSMANWWSSVIITGQEMIDPRIDRILPPGYRRALFQNYVDLFGDCGPNVATHTPLWERAFWKHRETVRNLKASGRNVCELPLEMPDKEKSLQIKKFLDIPLAPRYPHLNARL